ncbi:hypothetical protein MCOR27_000503 [Pyricularia oryzae]|uniref:Uncharacterized protein n=5 Tax=Pyricularia TaxID=48558 RepID=G5EH47_PYRO7|nr:uncharacterized protein MGG_17860 [Pyricularia oryzae 70-15]ELQ33638.1 hypothetical protein OOU_Y34scaffold00916g8 [Pyricularia oryzae Y34]KAH8838826.1 hypothetical protein MCOR01_010255 [Pyricularia oryzae]KAI6304114.1 hypothetical protein MCOR33_000861 [Pyricularia grisea]EAQ71657.1 hypothetical protein MGCH7_ch7g1064 [Pyricularia oryzae 70-15]EHA45796.1 hypothetical protein MGG_17860 [Pyricularia oryzae 70-15]
MPRDGSGRAHNDVEDKPEIAHGVDQPGSNVDRSNKAAAMPEGEKGMAIEGMNASGGSSQGLSRGPNVGQGKGASAK